VTKLFGAIRLVSGHISNTLDNLARNEKTRPPFMNGFWRQQQKPAHMSGFIITAEWLAPGFKASLGGHAGKHANQES
jgi:hypothetical protein